MTNKIITAALLVAVLCASCNTEYDCTDLQIQPVFIKYLPSDIDTFVLRKFKSSDNFQTLIDTLVVSYGSYTYYKTSNDSTSVLVTDGKSGIRGGFDWQLFIPAKNKTISVSDIVTQKKTGKKGFGMGPRPGCTNDVFSAKVNGLIVNFSNSDTSKHDIYIRN